MERRIEPEDGFEVRRQIDHVLHDKVDDIIGMLHLTMAAKHGGAQDRAAILFEDRRPDDERGTG